MKRLLAALLALGLGSLASLALAWPRVLTTTIGWVLAVASVVWFVVALRSRLPVLSQVCRESAPILVVAAALSTMAGVVVTKQLDAFALVPTLFILAPAFVSSAGALGGILSSRLATKLHLGLADPAVVLHVHFSVGESGTCSHHASGFHLECAVGSASVDGECGPSGLGDGGLGSGRHVGTAVLHLSLIHISEPTRPY